MAAFVPYILSIFSNPAEGEKDHLEYLEEEIKALQDIIDDAKAGDDINIDYRPWEDRLENDLNLQAIAGIIYKYRKKFTIIHYSGHADRATLSLQETDLRAVNFIEFIRQCESLKVVVLNACSTEGFVKHLLERTNVRAVIATNNPVKDKTAKIFSEEFYRRLVKNDPLTDCFINALSIALPKDFENDIYIFKAELKDNLITGGKLLKNKADANNTRGIKKKLNSLLGSNNDQAKWGLYTRSDDILDWKLFESIAPSELQAKKLKDEIDELDQLLLSKGLDEDALVLTLEEFNTLDENTKQKPVIQKQIISTEKELEAIRTKILELKELRKDKESRKINLSIESSDEQVISRYKENLGKLNYENQLNTINELLLSKKNDVFRGFIMHGTTDCCLDHLSRNIVRWLGINNDVEKVFYDFAANNIGDFWQKLKDETMHYLKDASPESIILELYKQFVDTNGETQKNFIFLFRNVAGKTGKDNNIERILDFWKKLISLWPTSPGIKKMNHNIFNFIIDSSCEFITEPVFKTSKEDAYRSLVSNDQLFAKTISILPAVAPIKHEQISYWEIVSDMPKPLRYDDDELKLIIAKTKGFFLPTVKEISINKIRIEGKKPVLLSYIKELIETP